MSLVNELIKGLLPEEEKKQTTAVYAGGFKPPTSGHFEVVQQALKENPEIDEFIIFVGAKERNGISQTESLLIWEIYNNYLPFKVKIEPTSIPPIKAVYDFAKNHPTREVLWVIGAREGNEEDFKDITSRTKSITKYPNLELRTIVTKGGVSGTAAREASKISQEKFEKFLPGMLNPEERTEVYNIVADKIQEIQTSAKEKDVDPKELKMGIKVEMEHTDDPAKAKLIALQHLAEDPKYYTKLASLGLEEKTQHLKKQKSENVAPNHKGKAAPYGSGYKKLKENASYGQHIDVIEKIAELTNYMIDNGMNIEPLPTMEFIDGDSENAKDFFGKTAYYDPNKQHIVLYTEGRHPKDIVRSYAHEMIHHIQYLEDRLGDVSGTNTTEDDHLDKIEQEANLRGTMTFRNWTDSLNENIFSKSTPQTKGYTLKTGEVITLKVDPSGLTYGSLNITAYDKDNNKIGAAYFNSDETNDPKILSSTDTSVKPDWRRKGVATAIYNFAKTFGYKIVKSTNQSPEGGKFTDSFNKNLNEAIVGEKIECDNCDWSWNIKDGGDDLFICHKCGHNNKSLSEGKKKDPFGLLAYAQELGRLREEENEYKVYLDMDGVLADFDQRFRDISGMEPREFENKYGTKAFWNLIDEENKIKFWVGIPVMSGAADLVDAVKDYNYELLTSPSAKKQSYLGKILWVKNHTGSVFPSKPRINFKKASEKHLVKPDLQKTDILIDDREDTIGRWNAAGGTGIVYKNISQVLNDLGKLGL
jgi:hypothetical protein